MDSYLTLIGSILIGTLLLLGIFNYQADLRQHAFERHQDTMLQETAINAIELMEWDLRQIGYNVNFPPLAVFALDSISFYADLFDDGIIDTVNYKLSPVSAAAATTNPADRILYRWSNSEPKVNFPLGVTDFKLRFFDATGDTTSNELQIRTIEATLAFESTEPIDGKYSKFFWRKKITPINLQPM